MDGANIKEITAEGLTYLNEQGEQEFISFPACFQNWLRWHTTPEAITGFKKANHATDKQVKEWIIHLNNETVVGGRDIGGYPETKLPSIRFYTEPPTRFEFPSQQEFYRINYLVRKTGWRTQDLA